MNELQSLNSYPFVELMSSIRYTRSLPNILWHALVLRFLPFTSHNILEVSTESTFVHVWVFASMCSLFSSLIICPLCPFHTSSLPAFTHELFVSRSLSSLLHFHFSLMSAFFLIRSFLCFSLSTSYLARLYTRTHKFTLQTVCCKGHVTLHEFRCGDWSSQ